MKLLLFIFIILSVMSCEESTKKDPRNRTITQNVCDENPNIQVSRIPFLGAEKLSNHSQTSLEIHWQHVKGASFYHVISIDDHKRKLLKSIPAPATSASLKNLIPDNNYKFIVRAIDEKGFPDTNQKILKIRTKPWPNYLNQKSLYFNSEQSVNLGPSNNFIKNNTGSISMWIKPNFLNGFKDARVITLHQKANAKEALSLSLSRDKLYLLYNNKKQKIRKLRVEIDLDDNQWHHVLLNIHLSQIEVFIDNKLIMLAENTALTTGSHGAHIGAYTASEKAFRGHIDEVIFFNQTLNDLYRSALFNNAAQSDPRSLIPSDYFDSWYRMGDSQTDGHLSIEDIVGDNNGSPFQMSPESLVILTP